MLLLVAGLAAHSSADLSGAVVPGNVLSEAALQLLVLVVLLQERFQPLPLVAGNLAKPSRLRQRFLGENTLSLCAAPDLLLLVLYFVWYLLPLMQGMLVVGHCYAGWVSLQEGAVWLLDLSQKAHWSSGMVAVALALLDVLSVSLLQLLVLVGMLQWRWCPYPSSPPVCCQLLWMLLVWCLPGGALWSLDLSQKAHWSSGTVAVALALLDVLSVSLLQLLVLVGMLQWRWCPYPSSPPVCCQLLWMLLVWCLPG